MNEISKTKFKTALSKLEDYDMHYSSIFFNKLQHQDYFEVLYEYGAFKTERLSRKYVYALAYVVRMIQKDQNFFREHNCEIYDILLISFQDIKAGKFKSYLSYFPNQLWEILLLIANDLDENQFDSLLEVLCHSDYLMIKLPQHIDNIAKSKHSKKILKYILKEVKYRRLLNEELNSFSSFSTDDRVSAVLEIMLDESLDFKGVMYRSSIYMRDYDKESSVILACSKLLNKTTDLQMLVNHLDNDILISKLHILKLIFRILKENEDQISIVDKLLDNHILIENLIESNRFHEEIRYYFTKTSANVDAFKISVCRLHEDKSNNFDDYMFNRYNKLLQNDLSKEDEDFFKSSISSMSYYDSSKDSLLTLDEYRNYTFDEILDVLSRSDDRWHSNDQVFISYLKEETENNSSKMYENIQCFSISMFRDLMNYLREEKHNIDFLKQYLEEVINYYNIHFDEIGLYDLQKVLEIYIEVLDENIVGSIEKLFISHFGETYSQDVMKYSELEENEINDIINKYINYRIGYLFEIRNFLASKNVKSNKIDKNIVDTISVDYLGEFQSYVLGANILHLVDENKVLEKIFFEQIKSYDNWFLEGYINSFNLEYNKTDFVNDHIRPLLLKSYNKELSTNYAVPKLSSFYTVLYANELEDINFADIFANEEILETALFTYQNTPEDVFLKRDLQQIIKLIISIGSEINPHTFERIIIALEHRKMQINNQVIDDLCTIINNQILTFDNYWQGYRMFTFLKELDKEISIDAIIKYVNSIINKNIECDYLVDFLTSIKEKYGKHDYAKIITNLKKNKKANHWLLAIN